jgi:hypothetical protein
VTRPVPVALAVAVGLAVVMTWPLAARPGSVARFDSNDGKYSLWNVAWVARALAGHPSELFDANIFHPHRNTLAYSEANLVAGAMAAPVYAITRNPIAAHNVTVFVALVLAFLATWQLARRLTGRADTALAPAAAFAFSAFVSAHTAHIQLLMIFVLPVALVAFHRFVERPGWGRAVVLGLALALAGLGCGQYGIMAGLVIGLGALWFARGQADQRRYWLGLALAVGVAAAAVAPAFLPYLELRRESGFKSAVNLDEAREFSADAGAYARSTAIVYRSETRETGEVLFPGFIVLGLAATALAAARRVEIFYAAAAVLAAWASFGPAAYLYTALAEVVPFMSFVRTPARFGVVVLLALSLLAAFGAARVARGRAWIAAALVAGVAVEVKSAWPLLEVPPVPEAYRRLAALPRGPVVEFHFPYKPTDLHNHAKFMYWSMWHWQPLVNGYSDYIPPDFRDMAIPINGFPDPESLRLLRGRGARYVVLHLDTYHPPSVRQSMLDRFPPYAEYVRPLVQTGNVWLYEIVAYPK